MKKIETQPQIRNLALQRAYCVYTFSHYWIIREIEAEPPLLPTISPYPTMRLETKPVLEPHVKLGGITVPKVKHV